MQLFSENPLVILSNLFLGSRYLTQYVEDVIQYEDPQQIKRFRHVVCRFLNSHVPDHAMAFLGLPERNGAQSYPKVSVADLKEFMAAVMLCTPKDLIWKASDVCSQICFLDRYYDIVPVEPGILTVEFWETQMQDIQESAVKALEDLLQKAKQSVGGEKVLYQLTMQS